jgi:hypothetical protein
VNFALIGLVLTRLTSRLAVTAPITVLVSLALATPIAVAQSPTPTPGDGRPADRIWIEPQKPTKAESDWYPRAIRQQSGKIISLDRDQLRWVVQGDEAESRIAASRVLWIEPGGTSENETDALRRFAAGDYAESLRPLLNVLSERPPVWRQQWISMLAAYAAWRSSRPAISLELVEQLDNRPLAPITLAWLPVGWRGGAPQPTAIQAASSRLSDSSPAVRLVAASWLLSSPERAPATAVLEQLSNDNERPWIAHLAETLLWRVATPPQVSESRGEWLQKLDSLPMVLQVGPTITLMEKLQSAGQSDLAKRLELSLKLTPPIPHPEVDALPP